MLRVLVGMAFVSIPVALLGQNTAAPPAPSAVVKTYCVSCHSGRAPAGRLALDLLDADHPGGDAEKWERVVRHLRARTMPPMMASRPDSRTYESTISALTSALDRAAKTTAGP